MFVLLQKAPPDSPERQKLREALAENHLPLVRYLARRFANRGVPTEDLVQVGAVGLMKAIDRFDPNLGNEFGTYAAPTVMGEIKRHFRDTGWLLHVPRSAQELQSSVTNARGQLSQELGRAPTVAQIAEKIGATPEQVTETLDIAKSYSGVPLDVLLDPAEGSAGQRAVAQTEANYEQVELREMLRPAFAKLSEQERQILSLRFVENKTQTEIAEVVGVSQMQVSRLLSRILAKMRDELDE
jgi:RNA polymerase sigma-B factor